jgi:hypothetical protein
MKKALVAAGVLFAATYANALVIDDFTSGPYAVSLQAGTDSADQFGTMLGSERHTFVEVESNPLTQWLDFTIASGLAITSSGTLLDAYVEVLYGFNTDLNVDLSGYNAFKVNFVSNDLPMTMLVGLGSSTGGQFEVISLPVASGVGFSVTVPFSLFTTFTSFGDVDFIGFGFDSVSNGDYAIGGLEVVPEPATIAALAVGLGALVARRRKA